jgi:hypothetical protein
MPLRTPLLTEARARPVLTGTRPHLSGDLVADVAEFLVELLLERRLRMSFRKRCNSVKPMTSTPPKVRPRGWAAGTDRPPSPNGVTVAI